MTLARPVWRIPIAHLPAQAKPMTDIPLQAAALAEVIASWSFMAAILKEFQRIQSLWSAKDGHPGCVVNWRGAAASHPCASPARKR